MNSNKENQKEGSEEIEINPEENITEQQNESQQKTSNEENLSIDEVIKEFEKAQEMVLDFKDKYLRVAAEYDNFRRRTGKERDKLYSDAVSSTTEVFLPVLDTLEKAVELEVTDDSVQKYKEGIEMVLRQFKNAFETLGITEIPAENEEFNPDLHNAIMHVDDETLGKNVIVQVFQKGYRKGERIIRHSLVSVAN